MVLGLLTVNLIAQIGLLVAFAYGYLTVLDSNYFRIHFIIAMPATFLAIFAHCMIMFYFIGTGRQIKDVCKDKNLDSSFTSRTRQFKSKTSPYITITLLLTMAVTIIGGGVRSGNVLSVIHGILGYLTVIANIIAFIVELKYLGANNLLLEEISSSLARPPK